MYLILWLLCIPKLFYHFLFSCIVVIAFLGYKFYHSYSPQDSYRSLTVDKMKMILADRISSRRVSRSSSAVHLALVVLYVSCACERVASVEQDAQILQPVAQIAKSAVKTATLGSPFELDLEGFSASDYAKNVLSFSWRTKFPVTIPKGVVNKTQDFIDRVRAQVAATKVEDVDRKSLANLRTDLDDIIDSIVEEVRRSPDGLYTDYLKTSVNGMSLEQASVAVGAQLKAYGVDLTNYRNIAGVVLGVPLMPTVASTVVSVAKLAPSLTNMTSSLYRSSMNQGGSAMDTAMNTLSAPLSMFGRARTAA